MAIEIRVARPADAAGILKIYAPYCESTQVSFEIVAPTREEMQARIERITATYPWLVGAADGCILGYVYATRLRERAAYQWAVEVAVYVSPDFQRRGLARTLYSTLFSLLRIQGFFQAFASVSLPNEASVALHQKVGFRPAGVFGGVGYKSGEWIDVGWWQRELQPQIDAPADPRPFSTIRDNDEVLTTLFEASRRANSIK